MALSLPHGSFFGRTTHQAEFEGYSISLSTHRRGERTPAHVHESPYVCLVLEGLFCEGSDGKEAVCEPGVGVFHPLAHVHQDRFLAGSTCLNMTFSGTGPSDTPFVRRSKRLQSYAFAVGSMLRANTRSTPLLEAKSLALACSFEAEPGQTSVPPWLLAVERYLDRSMGPHMTVGWLAEAFEIHPVHLARRYRSHFGRGIECAIEAARLRHAKDLLHQSDLNLAEIACLTGFSSPSRMCKAFKQSEGVPPGRFRESCRF